MKIIDLLNRIAKGEEVPKKIKFRGFDMIYDNCTIDYEPQNATMFNGNDLFHYLFEEEANFLNDEVEIIEEVEDKEEVKNDDDFTGVMGYCNGVEMFSINYTGDMEAYKKYLKKVRKDIDKIIEDKEYEDIDFLGKQDLYVDDARGYSVNIEKIGDKINALIRNQKKIIERLDK